MGFRDSALFNQALLARQAWRLVQSPESLAARLLKEIYFPRGNLLDTVFRADASPVWHGIEHGLALLKKGMIWRVGNGHNIKIWRDNWLPRNFSLKAREGKTRARFRRVNQLKMRGSDNWDEQLVRKIFYAEDAELILQMHAPTEGKDDFVAWHYESNGVFSVRSAYKLAYNLQHNMSSLPGTSTSGDVSRNIWKSI
jgi:hypothetical protein